MGPLIVLVTICCVVACGARILAACRLAPVNVPERVLCAAVLGFTLFAYVVLALGLVGQLKPWPVAVALALMALAGLGRWSLLWEGVLRLLNALARGARSRQHVIPAFFLLLFAALTFITALEPPGGREFDGLAQHLAQPQTYIRHAEIKPLWYDHHSFFPATLQMLYTTGLLYGSVSAAKLFHWLHGIIAVITVLIITRRFFSGAASGWAALVLMTTPTFLWMAGVSYVDLGTTAYGLVMLACFLRWHRDRKPADLLLTGLMGGCLMTTKMQGIFLFAMIMAAVALLTAQGHLARRNSAGAPRCGPAPLATAALAVLIGITVASPWYVRTWYLTGNPVYPFAYSIFGGKYWSAEKAGGYELAQMEFGLGDMPPVEEFNRLPGWKQRLVGPREPWKWLVGPFTLTFLPWEFAVGAGRVFVVSLMSIGPLWLALVGALVFFRRLPPAALAVLWLFVPLWLWWFFSMQLARYLLPSLAFLAPVAGYAFYRVKTSGAVGRVLGGTGMGLWLAAATGIMLMLALPALPVVTGRQPVHEYLTENLDVYPPSLYVSRSLPPDAHVVMYGEVRGFWLQRDHFWGDPGHSDIIDYSRADSPQGLMAIYREMGFTHVLINQAHLPDLRTSDDPLMRVLRESIEQGYLVPMTHFRSRPNFMLFQVNHDGE